MRRFPSPLLWLALFLGALISPASPRLLAGEPFTGRTIVIDPGHGGSSNAGTDAEKNKSTANNATSPTLGIREKDLTLELSLLIAQRLTESPEAKAGKVRAVLTRDRDVNLDFTRRADIAASAGAACFVAIHFNASAGHRAAGPRAVIRQISKNPEYDRDRNFGLALAKAVETASRTFRPETPAAAFHDDRELHNGQGSYLFHQLSLRPETRLIPACHLEVEFLDNRELEKLFSAERKTRVLNAWAGAIAAGLLRQVTPPP